MHDKKELDELIKRAKKISKDFDEKWEHTFAEMIIWALVNLVEINPKIWEELKKTYADKKLIEEYDGKFDIFEKFKKVNRGENGKSNKDN